MQLRDKNGLTEQEFLAQYRPSDYERPSVATDMVIFTVKDTEEENYRKLPQKHLQLLLIRRGGHPYLGCWALPGGFVRPNESAGQAARRELEEETGVKDVYLEQLYTFSEPKRDPRMWVMSCAHMALIDGEKVSLCAGDDAAQAAWFQVQYQLQREEKEILPDGYLYRRQYRLTLEGEKEHLSALIMHERSVSESACSDEFSILQNEGLAFDHARIIGCAIDRLRGKVSYSGIALHLMPPLFTLTELQQVYEAILDKELLKAAFRRKIAPLVCETDRFTENAGHRPSRLYRRNLEAMG